MGFSTKKVSENFLQFFAHAEKSYRDRPKMAPAQKWILGFPVSPRSGNVTVVPKIEKNTLKNFRDPKNGLLLTSSELPKTQIRKYPVWQNLVRSQPRGVSEI